MENYKDNIRFQIGMEILKKYEEHPEISDMGDELYVGNMCVWEHSMSEKDINDLDELGFEWYEEAECLTWS